MNVLQGLEPRRVFEIFEEICAIPHGSGNTEAIADYCLNFARKNGLEAWKDRGGNVVIRKAAAPGYEAAEPVIIQGHFDMVTEKTADCGIDFLRDGLRLFVDGDWIGAEGTTLGGDDGIAVAMGLAIAEDKTLPHPELEVVLTRDEETGMFGAAELEGDRIRGRRLLNIDSENEGVFTVSCAGGMDVPCRMAVKTEPAQGTVAEITVEGLTGGHSGVEIHHGRANACVLLGRLLHMLDCRIVSLHGGGKANAIARSASARVCLQGGWEDGIRRAEEMFRREYGHTDPDLRITVTGAAADTAMTEEDTRRCIAVLTECPNGVVKMSEDISGLVQTSANLGILQAEGEAFYALFSVRSSVGAEKEAVAGRIVALLERCGGTARAENKYPAWEYRKDSPLRDLMVKTYEDMNGVPPRVEAIHAGLECGLLAGRLPGLDAVSIGPDMKDIHTPQERLNIPSVERVWLFVRNVLKNMK